MVRTRMGRTETGTPARLPDDQGDLVRDGVRIHWEAYADADPETLARAIADGIASTARYRSVSGAGAGRAAALIAELL